jgi:PncC family amidohydrolase
MTSGKLVRQIAKKMGGRHQTLGIAESCTGGQISAAITALAGASKYFQGSIVSYDNSIKHDLLGVKVGVLGTYGAVSDKTARAMARGAKKTLKVDWAIAVTGIAGPNGGTPEKPVGLVFFAVVGPKVEIVQKTVFKGNRKQIQQQTVHEALRLLLTKIN